MRRKDLGLLVLILVVGAVVAAMNPRFLSPVNLADTANLVGLFGIFSVDEALVIVTGEIDLSVGSVIALLGVMFVDLVVVRELPWPLVVALVLAIGALLGLAHGFLVTRVGLQPFVVTLCGSLIYRDVARYWTADGTAGFTFGQSIPSLEAVVAGRTPGIPHSALAFAVVTLAAGHLLHRTIFGRHLLAVSQSEPAARYAGIDTAGVTTAAYVIAGTLAALAAVFFDMNTRSVQPASHGNFYELYGIAATVPNGFSLQGAKAPVAGVVLGTIPLQVLQNLVNFLGIPSSLNFAVMGGVILTGVLADSQVAAWRDRRREAGESGAGPDARPVTPGRNPG